MAPPLATLLVRNLGTLVTCDPERGAVPGVIEGAALAAAGEWICAVGPEREVAEVALAPDALVLDALGCTAVPGFVDAHSHLVWLGERSGEYAARAAGSSYEALAAAGGGIRATVAATAAGGLEELVAGARPRARRMLLGGTTTVEVKSGYGLDEDAELRQLAAAAVLGADPELPDVLATYLPLHATPEGDRAAFVERVCAVGVERAAGLARFVDAFCERGAYTVEECARLLEAGRRHGLGAKLHAEQRSRSGGARLAARAGAVSADHLEHASDDDLRALAAAGVTGVILPGASLVLGGPPPPGRRLLEAGARVAVATDCNPGTCYSESMPLMVALAVALGGLTPARALVAATTGGASALGLHDRGMLRPGMRCDLAILDTPHWLDLGYHLGANPVRTVIRAGRIAAG
ncbi:MAG TPA: imidazolonepropionase [Candidatus Dormibacteraeota bacterium]|nr:imidazolonepropionase [Candidatus Dormibacteraeota bacterium]